MCLENPLWGASRIHGELLKLGFEIAQSTVSKYMVRGRRPPSQSWKTFLRNHADAIAAIDLFIVPTVTFDLLYAFLVIGHGRRQLLWFDVTRYPTAQWLAHQMTEAFPWASAPTYLVRDNHCAYGQVFTGRLAAMGIRDRPISPGSPCQNGIAERLIGTLRRECLDHVVVFGETTPAPCAFRLCSFLQSNASASIPPEGCANAESGPTDRHHCRNPGSRRPTSSIRPDMIFGKDRGAGCRFAEWRWHVYREVARRFVFAILTPTLWSRSGLFLTVHSQSLNPRGGYALTTEPTCGTSMQQYHRRRRPRRSAVRITNQSGMMIKNTPPMNKPYALSVANGRAELK